MPRECEWVDLPDGGRALVMRDRQRQRCTVDGCSGWSERLCDFPLTALVFGGKPRTCDAGICSRHAHRAGPDVDYCPTHAPAGMSTR